MDPEPVSIAQRIVFGVAFDPRNSERVAQMDLNTLFASVGRLFDRLEEQGVGYVLVGGIAMRAYVEGRNTQDIDLVVASADLVKLPELRVEDRTECFVKAWFDDVRVDLWLADAEPFRTVREKFATHREFAGRVVRIATPEGLLLLKLFALPSLYRQAQFSKARVYEGDVATFSRRPARSLPQCGRHSRPRCLNQTSRNSNASSKRSGRRVTNARIDFSNSSSLA